MPVSGDLSELLLARRYRLGERVGAGSMGAVWRATDELLGRTVAVKQLLLQPGSPGFDPDGREYDEARQRILREGRLAARLQHPHTIAVFDVVLHQDVPWLVMEYLPSETLGDWVRREGPGHPRRIADIGRQVADGLAAAHAAGIVHRDIKPANVLLGRDDLDGLDGAVKITDFGVSRAADDVQLTRTGLIAGTPAYLAPEVARGQDPTAASDVFALGATLYAAVEGQPPFGIDDNAYALLYKVGAGTITPPERSGPLTGVLLELLCADPARRPTAEQARAALAAVAAGTAAVPAQRRAAGEARRPSRLRPRSAPEPGPGVTRAVPPTTPTRVDLTPPEPDGPGRPGRPGRPARAGSSGRIASRAAESPAGPLGLRARVPVVVGVLVLVAVLAVLAAVALPRAQQPGAHQPGTQQSGARQSAAAPSVGAPSDGTSVGASPGRTRPSAVAPAPVTPGREPTAAQLEGFVRSYYALLPDRPERAWAMLGPRAQGQSDGYTGYADFYRTLDSVDFAEDPTAVDDRTVTATVRFVPRAGGQSVERYRFVVTADPDGTLEMDSFSRG